MRENQSTNEKPIMQRAIEIFIRLGLLFLMLYWCYHIIQPFVEITLWSVIFAVALFPAYNWLKGKLGNKKKISAAIIVVLMILIFLLPGVFFARSLYEGVTFLKDYFETTDQIIPDAPASVANWPVIGKIAFEKWNWVSHNFSDAAHERMPEIKQIGLSLVSAVASASVAYLKFIVALIIAGFILVYSEAGGKFAQSFFKRIMGENGHEFADVAEKTIRTVVKGILGVAFIQSFLLGVGFAVAGIPATGLWFMLSLILGIVQIGPTPVVIPILIYAFATFDTFHAVALTVWCVLIGPLDNILKPILLGRGAVVPMLVIFIGAIGGFISSGIVGLFTGAIIFSIGYKIFNVWLENKSFESDTKTTITATIETTTKS
ncbi:MAG: AI-2E family transporter [Bacteroidia bacterium]